MNTNGRTRSYSAIAPRFSTAGPVSLPTTPKRLFFSLVMIAILGLAGGAERLSAACGSGGDSSLVAPTVTFLRAYRPSLGSPVRLAIDADETIYITDPTRGQVLARRSDGRLIAKIDGFGYPVSIAVDDVRDQIYIGNGLDGSVAIYSPTWQLLHHLGQGGGEFGFPADLAVDLRSGTVWVVDSFNHRVAAYSPSGALMTNFGGRGAADGQFEFPMGIFVDENRDEILVADQMNFRIQIFDLSGTFITCIGRQGSDPGELGVPQGLWVDSVGRIYVTDTFEGRIQILDRFGAGIGFIGDFGSRDGHLLTPTDLVIGPSGRLYVASAGNARLEIFGLDGYADPELYAPARVEIEPDPLETAAPGNVVVFVEVPGYPVDQIVPAAVTANGVPVIPLSASFGDRDGNSIPDLGIEFNRAALAQTFEASGIVSVAVEGPLGSFLFAGADQINVIFTIIDSDGDGIDDPYDSCPSTTPDSTVDTDGCSIDQICPCAGPEIDQPWANNGDYVTCVVEATREFVAVGLMSNSEARRVREGAARSNCGRAGSGTRQGAGSPTKGTRR